jgi:hypothetical protein
MGTRHTYRIIETYKSNNPELGQVEEPICLIYGQYDGYPEGTPSRVAKFIASGKMVNGYGADSPELVFNGTGCMTAQLIKELKDGTGNIYVQALSSRLNSGEDYSYDIICDFDTKKVTMIAYDWEGKELFTGTPLEFLQKYNEEVFATFN